MRNKKLFLRLVGLDSGMKFQIHPLLPRDFFFIFKTPFFLFFPPTSVLINCIVKVTRALQCEDVFCQCLVDILQLLQFLVALNTVCTL